MLKYSQPHRAFTLVELLVVIGIIAVLIAILMPALSLVKAQSNTIKCGSNLRSIGQVMQMYANENKGFVPWDYYYNDQYRSGHILWAEAFAPYLSKKWGDPTGGDVSTARDPKLSPEFAKIQVYQCPVFPVETQTLDYIANGGYIDYNFYITVGSPKGEAQPALKPAKYPFKGQIVYITEGNANLKIADFGNHDLWRKAHLPKGTEARVLNDERHRGKVNLLYLDGHVGQKLWKEVNEKDFEAPNIPWN